MSDQPRKRNITQPVVRKPAITDLPAPDAPQASSVRGGARPAPSTRGTMFGQMFSPFVKTQEVLKQPAPKRK